MAERSLCISDYPFHWTPKSGFNDRLIIPYYYENRLVGYTARRVGSDKNPRYFSEQQPDFVFNLDRQVYERRFVIVCEGPIDAISVDGCAILGSQIKDKQDWLLKRLNKEIILVPDRDHEGPKTVEQAIEYGWSVSMPEWPEGVKDVNDAVIKLGRLATLWLIMSSKQSYALKIQLRAKQFFK
jgi:DNA primase